jgi:hypothetical protein
MDSLIAASARALAAGDALGALKHVALRNDPPALAMRGIAMAQLGEHVRARELLREAARGFGEHEATSRARCVVAEAEVALAMRDLGGSPRSLAAAGAVLAGRGDRANALQARLIGARRLLLLGRLDDAAAALGELDTRAMPAALVSMAELASAELALRSLRVGPAQAALGRARRAAEQAGVPALQAEVAEALGLLGRPAARRVSGGVSDGVSGGVAQLLFLADVEALFASNALVVDACRRGVRRGSTWLPLARRPVLFGLARALGQAWPGGVDRDVLIEQAFKTRRPDETHRARLRVEIGRLRAMVAGMATIEATPAGFAIEPIDAGELVVLAPPMDGEQASLAALLADGAAWSTSALALALCTSQRTVQRSLAELEAAGKARSIGLARARRWLSAPLAGFTTILLLPAVLPFE